MCAVLQGFHGWVLLRSARGALVGAVRLALRFTSIGNVAIDTCLAAPSPMEQAAFALQGLPAPEPPLPSVEKDLFHGQWSRYGVVCSEHAKHRGTRASAHIHATYQTIPTRQGRSAGHRKGVCLCVPVFVLYAALQVYAVPRARDYPARAHISARRGAALGWRQQERDLPSYLHPPWCALSQRILPALQPTLCWQLVWLLMRFVQ